MTDIDAAHYFMNLAAGNPETSTADSSLIPSTVLRLTRSLDFSVHKHAKLYSSPAPLSSSAATRIMITIYSGQNA